MLGASSVSRSTLLMSAPLGMNSFIAFSFHSWPLTGRASDPRCVQKEKALVRLIPLSRPRASTRSSNCEFPLELPLVNQIARPVEGGMQNRS